MRLINKQKWIALLFVVFLLFVVGCAKKQVSTFPALLSDSGLNETKYESDRMLIWYASLELEVDKIDDVLKKVESIVEKNNGYIENNSLSLPENATFKIRIPSKQLNSILDQLAQLGIEKNRYISSEDVTEKYIDTEARLKNSISLRDRLKNILNKADKVSDILEIEKELTRIQSDIDSMEGILKSLKGKVDYATVDLQLKQKIILGPLGYVATGIAWVIKKLFVIR
jgi:hypothetical protein